MESAPTGFNDGLPNADRRPRWSAKASPLRGAKRRMEFGEVAGRAMPLPYNSKSVGGADTIIFNFPLSIFNLKSCIRWDAAFLSGFRYQITTRLEGARYMPSVFFTLKVAYHSEKFLGGILARR